MLLLPVLHPCKRCHHSGLHHPKRHLTIDPGGDGSGGDQTPEGSDPSPPRKPHRPPNDDPPSRADKPGRRYRRSGKQVLNITKRAKNIPQNNPNQPQTNPKRPLARTSLCKTHWAHHLGPFFRIHELRRFYLRKAKLPTPPTLGPFGPPKIFITYGPPCQDNVQSFAPKLAENTGLGQVGFCRSVLVMVSSR